MAREGTGRLFRRPDKKYLLYLPVDLCQDSAFPFKLSEGNPSIKMHVTWDGDKLIATKKS